MDNLKEIAGRAREQIAIIGFNTISDNACIAIIESALSEAYNLGIPVSVKEYAVEVLRELQADFAAICVEADNRQRELTLAKKEDLALHQAMKKFHYDSVIRRIESTITQIKSNPSGNIGIHKWIPVSERLPEEEGKYLCLTAHKNLMGTTGPFCIPSVLAYNFRILRTTGERINDPEEPGCFADSLGYGQIVDYWMPLPKMPDPPQTRHEQERSKQEA